MTLRIPRPRAKMCIRDRYYTIGQRKGLGIGGEGGPWFVVGKDVVHNELLVASGESNEWLLSDTCLVSGVNWLARTKPQGALSCCAKFRYRQKDNPVTLEFLDETTVRLTYPQQVASVTPGQQAVFYLDVYKRQAQRREQPAVDHGKFVDDQQIDDQRILFRLGKRIRFQIPAQ